MTATTSRFNTNQLLATLSSAEWQHLEPDLEWVDLPSGSTLHSSGNALRHVHFPTTATVSLVSSMADGASAEVAVVGSEGMVGVCAFMGGANPLSDAVVQRPGQAWRIVDMVPVGGFVRRAVGVGDVTLQEQHALAHSTQLLPPLLPGSGLHGTAPWRRCPA